MEYARSFVSEKQKAYRAILSGEMMFMNSPMVTVVMSVFNEENYLQDSIESILNQTFSNFEFIIVNDYSTDRSIEICANYEKKDSRIHVYSKTTEPKYLAASRNIGIGMARGDYIILQDADDVSRPDRIEKQLAQALQNPDRRVVGCRVKRIEDGKERILELPETHSEICKGFKRFSNRRTIVPGTILAPKRLFATFPYKIMLKYIQDWDHMLRMYESGQVEFYNCQDPLYIYFIREKAVLHKPEWVDYNIFVRNCQTRRNKGMDEFNDLQEFQKYLKGNTLERIKWESVKKMIALKLKLGRLRKAT
jgi:glycosyltransferase involved in cell wall biosynthesis